MIVSAIIYLIGGLIGIAATALPVSSLPSGVSSSFLTLVSVMKSINNFFPIDTLITLTLLALAIQGAILSWNIFNYFIRMWRGN